MTGFYGKLPAKGDFLSRNLPRSFVDTWDEWLQNGMHESRQALGDAWLQIYLTSPLWRFVLPPGVCGDSGWAGVFMPSMDRVGRYFPMAVVTELPAPVSPLTVAAQSRSWFESVEGCLLEALDDEALDLDAFDERLRGLMLVEERSSNVDLATGIDQGIRVSLDDKLDIAGTLMGMTFGSIEAGLGAHSVWWGQGSERIPPSLVLCRALPGPGRFTALLDGDWRSHGWRNEDPTASDIDALVSDIAAI